MTLGIPLGILFSMLSEKAKTHESVCFPIENVVPGHQKSINWGIVFRGVFREGSKTMFFEILGGEGPVYPQRCDFGTPCRLAGKRFLYFFLQSRGRAKIIKVRSPGVPEGRDGVKRVLGTRLVYTRLRSRKRHLQPGRFARPASRID